MCGKRAGPATQSEQDMGQLRLARVRSRPYCHASRPLCGTLAAQVVVMPPFHQPSPPFMKRIAFATLLAALSGCVTTRLSSEGEAVRVTSNSEAVQGCEYIGEVRASDRMNGGMLGQGAAEENTLRRLKNRTAEMGGNVVLLTTANAGMAGASTLGEAYRCHNQASS